MAKKKKKTARNTEVKKAPTKSEVYTSISDKTELPKRQVADVFNELTTVIGKSLKRNGSFTMPGICKMTVKKKPATKARPGRNPFTGEDIMIKAKPASKAVRIRPLKTLKDMVA